MASALTVQMGVDGGGGRGVVSHIGLDEAQMDAGFQQMCGIAVSQGVY